MPATATAERRVSSPQIPPRYAQLPLQMRLRDGATFGNYFPGAIHVAGALMQQALRGGDEPCLYLWGGAGTGKTHLLQAACHLAAAQSTPAAYLPCADAASLSPAMHEGLEQLALVALDGVA